MVPQEEQPRAADHKSAASFLIDWFEAQKAFA
jgi:hypothetical protein